MRIDPFLVGTYKQGTFQIGCNNGRETNAPVKRLMWRLTSEAR